MLKWGTCFQVHSGGPWSKLGNYDLSHAGQKVAFVGESGCGKSTTIQLLERTLFCTHLHTIFDRISRFSQLSLGFYDPKHGEVLVNGLPLRHLPVRSWRKMLGYVGQQPVLFATSAMENIKAKDGGHGIGLQGCMVMLCLLSPLVAHSFL